jgi:import inner membrane translocase subunit TIM23
MDPLAFAVICGIGSGVVGYMLGGATFNLMWKFLFRQTALKLQEREGDFLKRLQRYRYFGINKFDDDYYGDKVRTLADYRQWVRQQQRKKSLSNPPSQQ